MTQRTRTPEASEPEIQNAEVPEPIPDPCRTFFHQCLSLFRDGLRVNTYIYISQVRTKHKSQLKEDSKCRDLSRQTISGTESQRPKPCHKAQTGTPERLKTEKPKQIIENTQTRTYSTSLVSLKKTIGGLQHTQKSYWKQNGASD